MTRAARGSQLVVAFCFVSSGISINWDRGILIDLETKMAMLKSSELAFQSEFFQNIKDDKHCVRSTSRRLLRFSLQASNNKNPHPCSNASPPQVQYFVPPKIHLFQFFFFCGKPCWCTGYQMHPNTFLPGSLLFTCRYAFKTLREPRTEGSQGQTTSA